MRSLRCLGVTLLLTLCGLGSDGAAQADEFPIQPLPETYLQNELIPTTPATPPPATAVKDETDLGTPGSAEDAFELDLEGNRPAWLSTMDISDAELELLLNPAGSSNGMAPVVNTGPASGTDDAAGAETNLTTAPEFTPSGSVAPTAAGDAIPGTSESGEIEAMPDDENFHILGATLAPGEAVRLHWVAGETLYGGSLDTPVYVTHGRRPGLSLCLTAAIHGDELNGVEIVRTLMAGVSPHDLSGTLIGVPIVNLLGFTRGTRYLPDRRDLNRFFPGNARGSSASRIAGSFFEEVIRHCDRLVDLHTGSLNRINLPQLRADLDDPRVLEFTRQFGPTAVLHSRNVRGNLRTAAVNAGIPAVTFELGEPGSLQQEQIDFGVRALETLMDKLDMIGRRRAWSSPQPVYYSSRWVRVNNGGILKSAVKIGARIRRGAKLGTIINPLTSENYEITSPYSGRVLGMSLDQFMLPGFAAFHIGIVASDAELLAETQTLECGDYEQLYEEIDCDVDLNLDEGDEPEAYPEELSPPDMEIDGLAPVETLPEGEAEYGLPEEPQTPITPQ